MARTTYWYSVIQFQPSKLRGEKINVGLVFHNPDDGSLRFQILPDDSVKVRNFLPNYGEQKVYKAHRDFLIYFFDNINKNQLNIVGEVQGPSTLDPKFLSLMNDFAPESMFFSEPTFIMTENRDQLFESIIHQYVGSQFLRNEDRPVNTKVAVRNLFSQRNWIGTKVKPDIRLHPIKELPNIKIRVDFVFKNGVWNLIQTVPNSGDLTDWYLKTRSIVDHYKGTNLYVTYNPQTIVDSLSVKQTIKYLRKCDVQEVPIGSASFDELCNRIESEAKDISTIGDELPA